MDGGRFIFPRGVRWRTGGGNRPRPLQRLSACGLRPADGGVHGDGCAERTPLAAAAAGGGEGRGRDRRADIRNRPLVCVPCAGGRRCPAGAPGAGRGGGRRDAGGLRRTAPRPSAGLPLPLRGAARRARPAAERLRIRLPGRTGGSRHDGVRQHVALVAGDEDQRVGAVRRDGDPGRRTCRRRRGSRPRRNAREREGRVPRARERPPPGGHRLAG